MEIQSDFQYYSLEFRYDLKTEIWTQHEIPDFDEKKQFRIRMPSGRLIHVPDFYRTFLEFIEDESLTPYMEKYKRRFIANNLKITYHDGLIPCYLHNHELCDDTATCQSHSIPSFEFCCNIMMGDWQLSYLNHPETLHTYCISKLVASEIFHLSSKVIRLQSIFDHIAEKNSVLAEFMEIAERTLDKFPKT